MVSTQLARGVAALALLVASACSSKSGGADEGADEGNDDGGSGTTGAIDPTLTGGGPGMDATGQPTTTNMGFIMMPDGMPANQCDIWNQDCPEGEKCMPWANDGGPAWNATKCSPVDANPAVVGDSCVVEGNGVSGNDDCELGSMCWDVNEEGIGVCVGFCEGSPDSPFCSDPDFGCSISNDGVLILCLPFCDPLLQDCPEGNACYDEENGFFCSPDASGDVGAYGDPCAYLNACDPGLWCAFPESVPDCADSEGCCSEYCDLTNPQCTGAGQDCVAFYEPGTAPPGYEDVGACTLPL